jgi:hypothetical protein
MAPTILLVPGFWEGPSVYEQVAGFLQAAGFSTETVTLASTGHKSPNNPSMKDDIAVIRAHVTKLVEADKEVVLVLHSAAGFLGSNAIEGLEASNQQAAGKQRGVTRIVFLAAGIGPEGFEHTPQPFVQVNVSELCGMIHLSSLSTPRPSHPLHHSDSHAHRTTEA